jgi:hypothetical protein
VVVHGTVPASDAGAAGVAQAGVVTTGSTFLGLAFTGSGGTLLPRMTGAYCGSSGVTTLASLLASL